jgi:hypothetical protein
MQAHDAAHLALGLLKYPEVPFDRQTHRFSASTIVRALYGGEVISLFGPDPSKRIEELTNEGPSLLQLFLVQDADCVSPR